MALKWFIFKEELMINDDSITDEDSKKNPGIGKSDHRVIWPSVTKASFCFDVIRIA